VAQPCAQALERARLFEAAARSRREGERRTALLEAAFAAAPAAVALLDREGRYVRVNAAYASLSGASPEAHAGKTPSEIWPSLSLAAHADAVRGVIEGRKALEVILAGEPRDVAGGARRRVETWFPVRVGGQVVGIGVIVRGEFAGLA
jgi:PAS domain S-box-containing protein